MTMSSRDDELARLLLARHRWSEEIACARAAIRELDRQIRALEDAQDAEEPVPVSVAPASKARKASRTARSRSRKPAQELSQLDGADESPRLSEPPGASRARSRG